ncbi:MAG: response regulator [Planctomycetota bacterium]
MTILIVDDEREFQEIYTVMIEDRGYNLIYAYDGNEAMQMLNDNIPDLIILDMIMNMVAGDTFFLHLKGFQGFSDIPIIISSSMPLKQFKNLKKIDPKLVFLNKADLTKKKLIEEVDRKLGAQIK